MRKDSELPEQVSGDSGKNTEQGCRGSAFPR